MRYYCENCNRQLPLYFGRKKKVRVILAKTDPINGNLIEPPREVEFCSRECLDKYIEHTGTKVIY